MICTGYNSHITGLLMSQQILWKLILDDGTEIWSDFDMPDLEDPWTRARKYCNDNGKGIVEVRVIVPGQPENMVYRDENGLDKILIVRGVCKDIYGIDEVAYGFMTFGKVEDDGLVHVKRFYWPECAFGTSEELRKLTIDNEQLLFYSKKECGSNCKCQKNKQS